MFIVFASHWLSFYSAILLTVWNQFCRLRHLKPMWHGKPHLAVSLMVGVEGMVQAAPALLPSPSWSRPGGSQRDGPALSHIGELPLPQRAGSCHPQDRCLARNSSLCTRRHFEEGTKSTVFNSQLRPVSSLCAEHQLVLRPRAELCWGCNYCGLCN